MPFPGTGTLSLDLPFAGTVEGRWVNLYGQELGLFILQNSPEGVLSVPLEGQPPVTGISLLELTLENNGKKVRQVVRVF